MSKKGKILSMATVLLLVLSLVAVIPAGLAGAQVTGAVKFIDDEGNEVEFYSTSLADPDNPDGDRYDVVTVQVEDADEDNETIGVVRFTLTSDTSDFDLTNVAGPTLQAFFQGERSERTTFTFEHPDGRDGINGNADDIDANAGDAGAAEMCLESNTAGQWVCTLPAGHQLGDANEDGAYDAEDASYVRDTTASDIVTQTDVDGDTGSPIVVVSPGNDAMGYPTITIEYETAPDTVPDTDGSDSVTLSYETYDYNIREPSLTPIDLSGASVRAGASFDNLLNRYSAISADSLAGTIETSEVPGDTGTDNDDTRVVISFRYDQTDTIESVQVRSGTSGANNAVTLDLTETRADSGQFTNTVGLVTVDELKIIRDAARATFADTTQAVDDDGNPINDDTTNTPDVDESVADADPLTVTTIGSVTPGNGTLTTGTAYRMDNDEEIDDPLELLAEIARGPDGEVDTTDNSDGNTALANRLSSMLDELGLEATNTPEELMDRLLVVADGDTITATYNDRSPSAARRGTATVDLSPPTINVIEPANNLRTRDNTPRFHVQVIDTGAGIAEGEDVSLFIGDSDDPQTTVPVAIDDGFRVEFIPTERLNDGRVEWFIQATDAVGNNVADEPGGSGDSFVLHVDIAPIGEFNAYTGFGVNDAGTARTRSANTAVQVSFEEPVDGESIAAGDFEVSGVTPQAAFHAALLENTVTATVTTETVDVEGESVEQVVRTFDIGEFAAVDTDEDESYGDEYTVRDADGNSLPVASEGTDAAMVALTSLADIEAGDEITITYTFDASQMVFLTVAALDDDATPRVEIVDEISDSAGNLTDEDDDVTAEAEDRINPVLTVTLDSDTVGDPDGNGTAEGTITITSSEALSSAPEIIYGDAGFASDAGTRLREITDDLVWTLDYATDNSVTDMEITADGTDRSDNTGTSEAVTLTTDVTAPELASFTPAREADSDDASEGVNQGLDNVVRVAADWGEEDTVALTSTLSGGSLDGTVDVSANTFGEGNLQILGIVLDAGDYTWSIQVEDAIGNDSDEQTINFEVVAPTSFEIDLEPGWNLISVPTRLDAALPGSVFGDDNPAVTRIRTWSQTDGWRAANYVVVADDPATADVDESSDTGWAGDILALSPGAGYYVFSETGENVETSLRRIPGLVTPPPPQPLGAGWNLIGPQFFNLPITSETGVDADAYLIDVDWSVAYGFDADPSVGFDRIAPGDDTSDGDTLNAGSGYWVYLTADGEIVH